MAIVLNEDLSICVTICIWVLGFISYMLSKRSRASLSFALRITTKLKCFGLCLFDAIIELHVSDFLIGI